MLRYIYRSKIRSSRPRNDSVTTIKLEDLFGSSTFYKPNPAKYSYPNTVPQTKGSTLKGLSEYDEDAYPSHSSANVGIGKRRSQQFSYNNK